MIHRVVLDLETASTADLRTTGAAAYFACPDTQITVACYAIDQGPITIWRPGDLPPQFPDDSIFVAHNYLFEWHAWDALLETRHDWDPVPELDRWSCTMARSAHLALPLSLDAIGDALNLAIKKDRAGHALMLRMARPRSTKPLTWWHKTDPAKLAELTRYCAQDVAVERLLDNVIPELPDPERAVFLADGRMNLRGLQIDRTLVRRMQHLATSQTQRLDAAMAALTSGAVPTCHRVNRLQEWLEAQGYPIPDLQKLSVADALLVVTDMPPLVRSALLLRQEAARMSVRKLAAITAGISPDARARGLFQYGGAGRTLRWAGRRVQPQNFPRPSIKGVKPATEMILAGAPAEDLDLFFEDSPLGTIASCLRGCFVAGPGHRLAVADLAQIEARVIAWLAGQQDILDVFAAGEEDVYVYTARKQGSANRQFGKVLVLACGFGMGAVKFQATAASYGVKLDLGEADIAVHDWRDANPHITGFWWRLGRAALDIVAGGANNAQVGPVMLYRRRRALRIRLPSGRDMIYHDVDVTYDNLGRPNLTFMGVDPTTKLWSRQRTYGGKLAENITQAVARDLMAAAMVSLDAAGTPLVGTIHDELIAEPDAAHAQDTLARMLWFLRHPPSWAPGLPVDATGEVMDRYGK